MITLFRIDERLIHGQIAIKWSKHTGVSHIVVANDNAAKSPIIQKSLKMAAPADVKTAIKSIEGAIELLKDPRCKDLKILLLVNCPKDALIILKAISKIEYINVGNYGRIAQEKPGMPRKAYGNNIYCDEEEVKELKEILTMNIRCIYQTTPEEPAIDISHIFK